MTEKTDAIAKGTPENPEVLAKTYPKGKVGDMERYIDSIAPRLEQCSTRHLQPPELTAAFLTACGNNPKIYDCDKRTVALALAVCAELGLKPNTFAGHIYLIPYNIKGTLTLTAQLGYKGLLELARRTGQVESINAQVFYRQEVEQGKIRVSIEPPSIEHDWSPDEYPEEDIVGAYCTIRIKGVAQPLMEIMGLGELNKIRARSMAVKRNKTDSPWFTDKPRMYRKVPIKRLINGGSVPISSEKLELSGLLKALEHDDKEYQIVEIDTAATRAAGAYAAQLPPADEPAELPSTPPPVPTEEPEAEEPKPRKAPPQRQRKAPPRRPPPSNPPVVPESTDVRGTRRRAEASANSDANATAGTIDEPTLPAQASLAASFEEPPPGDAAPPPAPPARPQTPPEEPSPSPPAGEPMTADDITAALTAADIGWDEAMDAAQELQINGDEWDDYDLWTTVDVAEIIAKAIGASDNPELTEES